MKNIVFLLLLIGGVAYGQVYPERMYLKPKSPNKTDVVIQYNDIVSPKETTAQFRMGAWTSSDTLVATVNEFGVVTRKQSSNKTMICKTLDVNGLKSCRELQGLEVVGSTIYQAVIMIDGVEKKVVIEINN